MESTPLTTLSANHEDIVRENYEIGPDPTVGSVEESSIEINNADEGSNEKQNSPSPPSAKLQSSPWILILTLTYAALAVFAWTVLCILTFRPITATHYHTLYGTHGPDDHYIQNPRPLYAQNENWLQAARVIQAIVSVVTIPVVSAVCSKAAVVFTQSSSKRRSLTLRKTITLASRGWNEPHIYARLCRGGHRRYGSSLLLFAIFLNILGGVVSPLQSIFLHYSTTKTPASLGTVANIPDVLDLLGGTANSDDINLVAVLTRSAITSTTSTDPQSRLWTPCNNTSKTDGKYTVPVQLCSGGVANMVDMSRLIDPFVAYLPSGFNTGLIKQFIPRMNSTATRKQIAASEFPINCGSLPGAFYVHYSHAGEANNTNFAGNWSLMACMPANQSSSPWLPTRDRQDISERLYLNISMDTFTDREPIKAFLEITLGSTLGYFELPNYLNRDKPGPLLDRGPWPGEGWNSFPQIPPPSGYYRRDVNNGSSGMSNSSVILQSVSNKGPLLNIAMALFGENSFIANRFQHPEVFIESETNTEMWDQIDNGANQDLFVPVCVEQEPLMGLLMGQSTDSYGNMYPGCILNNNNQDDTLQQQVEGWILSLYNYFAPETITNAFEAAAFLANEAWLVKSAGDPTLFVSYDLGKDTDIPIISKDGIIFVSVLLSTFLVTLLALAIYSTWTPVWTSDLDAFAMMRIGASMADKLSLVYVRDSDKVATLDELPGWIGDATEGHGVVGELGFGAKTRLTRKRKIRCYEN